MLSYSFSTVSHKGRISGHSYALFFIFFDVDHFPKYKNGIYLNITKIPRGDDDLSDSSFEDFSNMLRS